MAHHDRRLAPCTPSTQPVRSAPGRRRAGGPRLSLLMRAALPAAACASGALCLPVFGQTAPADAASAAASPSQLEHVTITGSNLRRTDAETPSPVQVLSSEDIRRSGYTSLADVLHGITANNMGSLSQANPGAFAAGGSGIALRGLTVGATLVLINGHRMASYPFPDDGERDFVDIASLPLAAIERVEVLKDGASAVYGSDAIAGVVNVILKKSLVGTTATAEAGFTKHGGGKTQHAAISSGIGDLDADGHNGYLAFEYRHQDPIRVNQRPYLAGTDWTPFGGDNLTQGTASGATSGASSGAGSGTGYLTDAAGNPFHYYPGCTAEQAAADQCGYVNNNLQLQPETTNIDLLGRYSFKLNNDWTANVQGSVLRSQTKTTGLYNNAAATGVGAGANGGGLNLFKFSPGIGPTPAFPDQFPFVLTVPAGYPGNTSGEAAPLVYDFLDIGPLTQKTQSTSYRLVAEVDGELAGWSLNAAAGYTRVASTLKLGHYIDFPALQSALDDQSYLVGGSNSPDVLAQIAPAAQSTATNQLSFVSVRASRELMDLPGGPLSVGGGAEFTHRSLRELFPQPFLDGRQASGIYSFAVGQQNVTAGYVELAAPVLKTLELDAAGRLDHYDSYGNSFTPKLGFKFSPLREFTLRGTYSRGFRAPSPTEIGQAGSTSGFVGGLYDPATCPGGPLAPGNDGKASCNIALQELQLAAPGLKPEKSRSFTLGVIFEPTRDFNATLDYYRIRIRDQIISVGQLDQAQLDNADQLGVKIYRDADGNILYDTYPFINANTTTTSGLDLNLRGSLDFKEYGRLTADWQTTYMLQYDLTAQGVTYKLAGTHGPAFVSGDTGTPRARSALALTWSKEPFEITGTINWISRYGVTDPSGGSPECADALVNEFSNGNPPAQFCTVRSFTTFNLSARVAVNKQWDVHASVINLFNRRPPYDLETFGSAGNGAQQGGTPYNPALHQDGAIGANFLVGATYRF